MNEERQFPVILITDQLPKGECDYSAWFLEKSDFVLDQLCRLADCLRNISAGKINEKYPYIEEAHDLVSAALGDALKLSLMSAGDDTNCFNAGADLIRKSGYSGLRSLMQELGRPLQEDVVEAYRLHHDDSTRTEMASYICGPRDNATMVHRMLDQIKYPTAREKQMASDLEKVTMLGEYDWGWFVDTYKQN